MNRTNGSKELRDPVHGDLEFDKYEFAVINTPQFQRMRGIRQLGLAHLVYPGAQHTRFEHSLGVAHMATRIVERSQRKSKQKTIDENGLRFLRILALVHDIGHIPFGHTLEDERPVFEKEQHHDGEERLRLILEEQPLQSSLQKLGREIGRPDLIEDLIRVMQRTHKGEEIDSQNLSQEEVLFANIVGNTICADLLDYLRRDPYYTGIRHSYDERLFSVFELVGTDLYLNLQEGSRLRRGVASEILHLLRLRYTLGERVYYHLTKASASAMISKAVELSGLPHEVLVRLRDDELLFILENSTNRKRVFDQSIKNAEQVAKLVSYIRGRRLYSPVYTITRAAAESEHCLDVLVKTLHSAKNRSARATLETAIAKYAGLEPHQVIIYCPHEKMSKKAAMVKVLWPKETAPKPLQELCETEHGIEDENTKMEINQLKRKHELLWQLNVFVAPDCPVEKYRDISAFCQAQEAFSYIRNQTVEYCVSPDETILERTFRRAVETVPDGWEVDTKAAAELLAADHKGGVSMLTPEQIQKKICRKRGLGYQRKLDLTGKTLPTDGNDNDKAPRQQGKCDSSDQ